MFENSLLHYNYDASMDSFIDFSQWEESFNNIDPSLLAQSDIYLSENIRLSQSEVNNGYYTGDDDEAYVDATVLSIIYNNGNGDMPYVSVAVPSEDAKELSQETVSYCLYICLANILYRNYQNNKYVVENLPWFWESDVLTLNISSLSGNFNPNNENFQRMFNQLMETFNEPGWDVLFSHFNDETRLFTNKEYALPYIDFINYMFNEGHWQLGNNIWLWACDGGYTQYAPEKVPAVAFEIANHFGVEVKAAPGTIVLSEERFVSDDGDFISNMNYYVVDLHGTKWYDVNIEQMSYRKKERFRKYVLKNQIPRDQEWLYFRAE